LTAPLAFFGETNFCCFLAAIFCATFLGNPEPFFFQALLGIQTFAMTSKPHALAHKIKPHLCKLLIFKSLFAA